MTRPKPIRLHPNRLPPLTRAQADRVKLYRRYFKGKGNVSVLRRGQRRGQILIKVTTPDRVLFCSYGPDGELINRWIQQPMFTSYGEQSHGSPQATNPYMED